MKDEYKRLSREWGSKARKEEGRQRKPRLKRETRKRVEEEADDVFEHVCGPECFAPCIVCGGQSCNRSPATD